MLFPLTNSFESIQKRELNACPPPCLQFISACLFSPPFRSWTKHHRPRRYWLQRGAELKRILLIVPGDKLWQKCEQYLGTKILCLSLITPNKKNKHVFKKYFLTQAVFLAVFLCSFSERETEVKIEAVPPFSGSLDWSWKVWAATLGSQALLLKVWMKEKEDGKQQDTKQYVCYGLLVLNFSA